MAKKNNFYNRLSSANVMSDGMLKEVSYGDYALAMVLKDKPEEIHTNNTNHTNDNNLK